MVEYKIVKYCRSCKIRYVVNRGESKKNFCEKCQLKIDKEREQEQDTEEM